MSQYLTKFYCGNKDQLCNYDEPIDYTKILDRQFNVDNILNCKGVGRTKGYCCDTEDKNKLIDKEYMKKMNNKIGDLVFHSGNCNKTIEDHIPLIKPKMDENNNISYIDVCNCGGNEKEYNECIKERCIGYRPPTRYEYCKMGNNDNKYKCYIEESKGPKCKFNKKKKKINKIVKEKKDVIPNIFNNPLINLEENMKKEKKMLEKKLNKKNKEFARCKLSPVMNNNENYRIQNLYPDCYLNLCNRNREIKKLDQMSPNTYNTEYHDVNIGFTPVPSNGKNVKKSISDYLRKL
jgi:hypothetical protein